MKKCYLFQLFFCFTLILSLGKASAQCPGGYTSAQLNWDNLDYYWNGGGSSTGPYQTYITNAMEQTQKFAFGTTWLTIATNNADVVTMGTGLSAENANHTGEITNYTGQDVQFTPGADGRTVTITFNTPVSGPNFTLYDIDRSAVFTITATDNTSAATSVNVTTYAGTILTVGGSPTSRTITATSATLANNVNTGSATITVPGLVNSITITITTRGSDAVFWLSDINACVSGSFPSNWHQGANNRPFVGPTQNQPDYFLVTPDNNSCYYLDPVNAQARLLFTDTERDYINSFAYDPYNRFLYYITEDVSINASNKQLKRYDYNTETSSVVIADITATLGIPTFNYGVESAGAAFYDGALYFGIEGGKYDPSGTSNDRTRETIVWKIEFDGSNNPTTAYQVFAADAFLTASTYSIHDWGDFIVKDGILYDYNTARNGSVYTESKFHHFNMMTGAATVYNNPGTALWNGQAGLSWNGNQYYFRGINSTSSGVGTYDGAGNCGAISTITVMSGPLWTTGGAGDASDPFRPKCDFGDAPDSYDPYVDPATQSPAVHERTDSIRLGAGWNYEYWKRGTASTDDTDDGLAYTPLMSPGGGGYVAQVSAYNHSGADATLIAWLDYNGNGVFDASEAITPITVPSSSSAQNIWLYWPVTTNSFSNGDSTYLRIRITSASAGMTSSHATGYFANGEVEDYKVLVDNFPLASHLLNFNATLEQKKVALKWKVTEDVGVYAYEVERSKDNLSWSKISTVSAKGIVGTFDYTAIDNNPYLGTSFYRVRIIESAGMNRYSGVERITINDVESIVNIAPNPAKEKVTIRVMSKENNTMKINIIGIQGNIVLTKNQKVIPGLNNIELQLPDLIIAGTYILRIEIGEEIMYRKLIINK